MTVSFLGIHKWEPDICIGFSTALHLQCTCPSGHFSCIFHRSFPSSILYFFLFSSFRCSLASTQRLFNIPIEVPFIIYMIESVGPIAVCAFCAGRIKDQMNGEPESMLRLYKWFFNSRFFVQLYFNKQYFV